MVIFSLPAEKLIKSFIRIQIKNLFQIQQHIQIQQLRENRILMRGGCMLLLLLLGVLLWYR